MQLASDTTARTKSIFVNFEFNNLLPQHYFKILSGKDITIKNCSRLPLFRLLCVVEIITRLMLFKGVLNRSCVCEKLLRPPVKPHHCCFMSDLPR